MKILVSLSYGRHKVLIGGLAGVVALAGLFAFFQAIAGSLTPQEAETRIREYLRWRLNQRFLAELDQVGRKVPDLPMAKRWKEESDRLASLEFLDVSVKRSFPAPPLRRRTIFNVRAVLRDADNREQTRYFRFNGVNMGVLDIIEIGDS